MTVTIWLDTDAEETIELGATLPFYQAWAEIVSARGDSFSDDYPDLAGVASQCEDQEDADPEWLADVRLQAADMLKEHGADLSDRAQAILSLLAGDNAEFADTDPFDFGDVSFGGLSREEIAEILVDAALDARDDAEFAAEFYDPNQLRDERGRWTTGGGSGGTALPHTERQAQRETAKETVRRYMAGKGSPSLQEASGLARALSALTVAQLHEVKREHGLKASAKDKAGLVAKLAERFRAVRESKPAEPKPSESKVAGSKASDLRREAVKSAIGETYSRFNGTHLLLQEIAAQHDTLASALAEAERQGLIDTRQRGPQADVSPLQRDRQGEWVRRVLGQAYGEKETPDAKPKPVRDRVPEGTYGPSKASIRYHDDDERQAVETDAKNFFGRRGTPQDFASAAGAPDDARVFFTVEAGEAVVSFYGVRDDKPYNGSRTLSKSWDGKITVTNDDFTGKTVGLEMFGRQVEQATRLGIGHIDTLAAGYFEAGPDPKRTYAKMNGYVTWPKFGYDGELDKGDVNALPPNLRADVEAAGGNIRGLMASKEGQDWWLRNGHSIDLRFDLTPGSYSQRTLAAYLEKRGILK